MASITLSGLKINPCSVRNGNVNKSVSITTLNTQGGYKMFKWLKDTFTKGEVKIQFIAYDDSIEEIKPYEDVASIPYEGEYDEFMCKRKLAKFIRMTKDHLVVEMTVIERTENGKQIED